MINITGRFSLKSLHFYLLFLTFSSLTFARLFFFLHLFKSYWSNFYISCIFQNKYKKMVFRNRKQLRCFQRFDFQRIFSPSATNHALPPKNVIKENCVQKNTLGKALPCKLEVSFHDVVGFVALATLNFPSPVSHPTFILPHTAGGSSYFCSC